MLPPLFYLSAFCTFVAYCTLTLVSAEDDYMCKCYRYVDCSDSKEAQNSKNNMTELIKKVGEKERNSLMDSLESEDIAVFESRKVEDMMKQFCEFEEEIQEKMCDHVTIELIGTVQATCESALTLAECSHWTDITSKIIEILDEEHMQEKC